MATKKEHSNHEDKPAGHAGKQNAAGQAKGGDKPRANAKAAREKDSKELNSVGKK